MLKQLVLISDFYFIFYVVVHSVKHSYWVSSLLSTGLARCKQKHVSNCEGGDVKALINNEA